jgi:type II secretory ATPase GspE/PulE/Tfp pilus assembly ATPase PilB-like protein
MKPAQTTKQDIDIDLSLTAQEINDKIRLNPGKKVNFIRVSDDSQKLIKDVDFDGMDFGESKSIDVSNESANPIIEIVNKIIEDAASKGASDIHIDPKEDSVLIRYRVHGTLIEAIRLKRNVSKFINARIKIMSSLNITEKRKPQDGKSIVSLNGTNLDLRVSFIPSTHGERCVIRLLNSQLLKTILDTSRTNKRFDKILKLSRAQNGMLIVCGPTGSGKSTTMYGILNEINSKKVNILTIEDPVEYDFKDIAQTQVDEKNGMGFVDGLRSILRQDPDVIMIGEIRDIETAKMAVQSSLTGHMVFTTLHTSTAVGAITRMRNLGIDSHLLSSSLTGIVSQRLMRTLCTCAQKSNRQLTIDKHIITEVMASNGCKKCNGTGYLGRQAVYGVLEVTTGIKNALSNELSESELSDIAGSDGMLDEMISMVESGDSDLNELEIFYKS